MQAGPITDCAEWAGRYSRRTLLLEPLGSRFFLKILGRCNYPRRQGYLLAGLRDSGLVAGPHIGTATDPTAFNWAFAALAGAESAGNRDRDDRSTMGNRDPPFNFLAVILMGA